MRGEKVNKAIACMRAGATPLNAPQLQNKLLYT